MKLSNKWFVRFGTLFTVMFLFIIPFTYFSQNSNTTAGSSVETHEVQSTSTPDSEETVSSTNSPSTNADTDSYIQVTLQAIDVNRIKVKVVNQSSLVLVANWGIFSAGANPATDTAIDSGSLQLRPNSTNNNIETNSILDPLVNYDFYITVDGRFDVNDPKISFQTIEDVDTYLQIDQIVTGPNDISVRTTWNGTEAVEVNWAILYSDDPFNTEAYDTGSETILPGTTTINSTAGILYPSSKYTFVITADFNSQFDNNMFDDGDIMQEFYTVPYDVNNPDYDYQIGIGNVIPSASNVTVNFDWSGSPDTTLYWSIYEGHDPTIGDTWASPVDFGTVQAYPGANVFTTNNELNSSSDYIIYLTSDGDGNSGDPVALFTTTQDTDYNLQINSINPKESYVNVYYTWKGEEATNLTWEIYFGQNPIPGIDAPVDSGIVSNVQPDPIDGVASGSFNSTYGKLTSMQDYTIFLTSDGKVDTSDLRKTFMITSSSSDSDLNLDLIDIYSQGGNVTFTYHWKGPQPTQLIYGVYEEGNSVGNMGEPVKIGQVENGAMIPTDTIDTWQVSGLPPDEEYQLYVTSDGMIDYYDPMLKFNTDSAGAVVNITSHTSGYENVSINYDWSGNNGQYVYWKITGENANPEVSKVYDYGYDIANNGANNFTTQEVLENGTTYTLYLSSDSIVSSSDQKVTFTTGVPKSEEEIAAEENQQFLLNLVIFISIVVAIIFVIWLIMRRGKGQVGPNVNIPKYRKRKFW